MTTAERNKVLDEAIKAIKSVIYHNTHTRRTAIRAIENLKTCIVCEKQDVHTNGFCIDCAREHYE